MKQKLLLSCCLLGSILGQAQFVEPTTYRGAFAPAPAKQWIDNWTNFDPQNASYPATTVTVTGNITTNTTWTKNNTYLLDGLVYVQNNATLTIEAGTVIRGAAKPAVQLNPSTLIITKGSKLIAEGTECNPIVFTSNEGIGARAKGQWGGIIILGNAQHNLGGASIEGLPTDPRHEFGKPLAQAVNDENSGILKYIRIEYAGFFYTAANEINGLTLGSVGSGTTIDYVQVSFNDDDAFEWFGGTVNAKHLVAYRCADDDFDTDNGYSGTVQFGLAIKDPQIVGGLSNDQSNGFESNNTTTPSGGTANYHAKPNSFNNFYNMTMLGAFRCGSAVPVDAKHRRGAHLRVNTHQSIYNSIFLGYRQGLHIENAETLDNIDTDSSRFRNNLIGGDYTTNPSTVVSFDAATNTRFTNPAYGNESTNYGTGCDVLVNPFPLSYLNGDYRPNTAYVDAVTGVSVFTSEPDLFAAVDISSTIFSAEETKEMAIVAGEGGISITDGSTVTVKISKLSSFTITVPGLTLSGTPQSGTNGTTNGNPNNNGDWNFYEDASSVYAVLKPGKSIAKSGFAYLGFSIKRNTGAGAGTQNFSAEVTGGGDNTPLNNVFLASFSLN